MCTEKCFELTRQAATTDGRAESSRSRRAALVGGATVAATAALGGPARAGERAGGFSGRRHGLRDLTYPLTTSFPAFTPGEEAVRRTVVTIENDGYYLQEWRIIEHILRAFERRHERIPHDAAVLMHSGWGAKVGDADAYRGTDATGVPHFPGFGADACEWLLRRRGIRSLGVDTLSIDPGNSATLDTHLILTGADRYGLENLANLNRIPRRGATIMVGLIPFEQGSGGQARIFASW